ncbi:recombinase family protein [Methylobacter sp.]|uniref:recombinase family protein n=1 Tax=Methylobacter sp. TaxID=2051955 RepID=UPI003DA65796
MAAASNLRAPSRSTACNGSFCSGLFRLMTLLSVMAVFSLCWWLIWRDLPTGYTASFSKSYTRNEYSSLRKGDVLVVTRLDRLARATKDLLELAELLNRAGAGLRSLGEPWADTTSPSGKMVLTVFAGIAEFERSLIAERTHAGRLAAQKKGIRFGRPPKLSTEQIALGHRLCTEGTSVRDAARILNCHHATLYRAIGRFVPPSDGD